ncbi:hypothetical protein GCM10010151_24440 [Actinoallomurus spadix]|uniref:Uncharacterized protein n=1 Tax=Actinoallomurus spadix TaxID=79912 RepID=A0ABP3G2J5_9ACTN
MPRFGLIGRQDLEEAEQPHAECDKDEHDGKDEHARSVTRLPECHRNDDRTGPQSPPTGAAEAAEPGHRAAWGDGRRRLAYASG